MILELILGILIIAFLPAIVTVMVTIVWIPVIVVVYTIGCIMEAGRKIRGWFRRA